MGVPSTTDRAATAEADPELFRKQFEEVLRRFPVEERVRNDPVSFPRKFLESGRPRAETEAVALVSAMLAYGRVSLFMGVIRRILVGCHQDFLGLVTGKRELDFWPGYRLSTGPEIARFCRGIGSVILRRGGLWEAFQEGWSADKTVRGGMVSLRESLVTEISRDGPLTMGLLHLLPDPRKGGCCKRWNMFLRWMARPDDGVDLGIWPGLSPACLVIPVDRHIGKLARNLGMTRRGSDDWQTAEEITAFLRKIDPGDPVRFDFPLCHLGISGVCSHGDNPDDCKGCPLGSACGKGNK